MIRIQFNVCRNNSKYFGNIIRKVRIMKRKVILVIGFIGLIWFLSPGLAEEARLLPLIESQKKSKHEDSV